MWSSLRSRVISTPPSQLQTLTSSLFARHFCSSTAVTANSLELKNEMLSLEEVHKVLNDVGADDVKVIPAPSPSKFADYMVIATGRSPWHVRNICQALIYQVKQKQKGAKRMLLPSVVGREGGKWIVIDSGTLIIHAVDENARAYYNLEGLWNSSNTSDAENLKDLQQAFVRIKRQRNNSKKPSQPQEPQEPQL